MPCETLAWAALLFVNVIWNTCLGLSWFGRKWQKIGWNWQKSWHCFAAFFSQFQPFSSQTKTAETGNTWYWYWGIGVWAGIGIGIEILIFQVLVLVLVLTISNFQVLVLVLVLNFGRFQVLLLVLVLTLLPFNTNTDFVTQNSCEMATYGHLTWQIMI